MMIMKLKGGLGNQMFQYALFLQLMENGRKVKMDEVNGFKNDPQRTPLLRQTFGVEYETASQKEIIQMTDSYMDLFSRVRRKLFGRKTLEYQQPADGNFDPRVFEMEDAYLEGFFQSEKFFPSTTVRERLRREFALDPQKVLLSDLCWERYQQIRETNSVSIHIRRGDYLEPGTRETFGGICTEDYYVTAVEYILEKYPDAVFYIFSNDKDWTAKHLTGERFITCELDETLPETADMFLMSQCRHHILANSSFSWWSAWLSDTPRKTVVAPKKWLNTADMHDIYTERMVRL